MNPRYELAWMWADFLKQFRLAWEELRVIFTPRRNLAAEWAKTSPAMARHLGWADESNDVARRLVWFGFPWRVAVWMACRNAMIQVHEKMR